MRVMIVVFVAVAILAEGCSAIEPPVRLAQAPSTALPNAKEVSCVEMGACYDSAKGMCNGPWHHVARPGEPFPYAEVGSDKRYRMLVACGEEK